MMFSVSVSISKQECLLFRCMLSGLLIASMLDRRSVIWLSMCRTMRAVFVGLGLTGVDVGGAGVGGALLWGGFFLAGGFPL